MENLDKKKLYIIGACVLVCVAVLVFALTRGNTAPGQNNSFSVVGTWYSDKPDSVTFSDSGAYEFSAWNGGNPWLSFSGTYSVEDNLLTLESMQDGTTQLNIEQLENGNYKLVGKYTYYQTEEEALNAAQLVADEEAEAEANIIPNTVNLLVGEWVSLDETVICTFTETSITVFFKGNDVLPEETLYYEYELLNDKLINISKSGVAANYPYTLTEKNGTYTFYCTGINYAPTYTKVASTSSLEEDQNAPETTKEIVSTIISSEKDPDKSSYTEELDAYVNEMLVGTWKGTFDDWVTPDSTYWIYTFSSNGSYTFTDGSTSEAGTYKTTSDPNNNYYHSELTLTHADGEKNLVFYFTTTDPVKMITADQTDPTFIKE